MKIFIAFAAIAGLTTSMATAAPTGATRVEATTDVSATMAAPTDTRRYCITEMPTGSRIPVKQCRTRAQWALDGIDVDKPEK